MDQRVTARGDTERRGVTERRGTRANPETYVPDEILRFVESVRKLRTLGVPADADETDGAA